jgi:hypothetical protein
MNLITPKLIRTEPDNDGWTIPTGKQIPVIIDESTGQVEWQHKGEKLTTAEIAYVAAALDIKKPPADRWQRIKSATLAGKTQSEIVATHKGQRGFTMAEVKKVRAALSTFNGWNLKGRYKKQASKNSIPLEIVKIK